MPTTSATAAASTRSCREEQYSSVSSSSQFFMNTPTTSCPSRLSSHAATDESTPPESPSTMRNLGVFTWLKEKRAGTTPCPPWVRVPGLRVRLLLLLLERFLFGVGVRQSFRIRFAPGRGGGLRLAGWGVAGFLVSCQLCLLL